MPRVIVIAQDDRQSDGAVLLDEQVHSIHIDSEHSASQFIQRLGWAISDAGRPNFGVPARAAA
jgi:hypothetical protein